MMGNKCGCKRLSAVACGVSLGVLSGIWLMLFVWAAWQWEMGVVILQQWSTVYIGLEPSLKGGLIGLAWGFLHGFVLGLLFAWIYNLCVCCCASRCCGMCGGKAGACGCPTK
jgi:hypothetical protein